MRSFRLRPLAKERVIHSIERLHRKPQSGRLVVHLNADISKQPLLRLAKPESEQMAVTVVVRREPLDGAEHAQRIRYKILHAGGARGDLRARARARVMWRLGNPNLSFVVIGGLHHRRRYCHGPGVPVGRV